MADESVSAAETSEQRGARHIVGLGASAGGLEALRTLFARLGKVESLALVVVQHLAPQHRSRLVELIAHETPLEVTEASNGTVPRPGVIYVTPPNADVVYERGALQLRNPTPKIGPKPSVDLFLTSLAHSLGDHAVGVILSGTGSDGAHGVRAVKAAGGVTLCQQPESAKYDGMPKAALQTGAVDLSLPPERLAEELQRIDRDGRPRLGLADDGQPGRSDSPFHHILGILRANTGVDLDDYKRSTIQRRIERRMHATGSERLPDYAQYLEDTPGEAQLLFADILISVTSFFRDAEAFESLGQCMEEKVRSKHTGEQLRCWVAGCATGEEAFSLAILIREAMERTKKRLRVQIFATDLDEQALLIARKATYSKASLTQLPSELTERYFTAVDDRLQVVPELRDMVVFAKHNLAEDPPFLGLDVVSCRNVLIYFTSRLQERVLRTVHYSLDPRGILFLGKSETAGQPPGLFEPVDKQSKIYLRTGQARELPRLPNRREQQREAHLVSEDREASRGDEFLYSLIRSMAPDSVLIDETRQIQQLFGNAGDYLRLPMGAATMVLNKLLDPELGTELHSLLHRAEKLGRAVHGRRRVLDSLEGSLVRLMVAPIHHGGRREYLIGFEARASEPEEPPVPRPDLSLASGEQSPEERITRLEMELRASREQLQNTLEEHDTATEELQALNEELQSTNEELQSSNEELETTNEELQSSNEELTTLNQELNVKSAELQTLNQRLHAVQSAIQYPLLIIDRELRLQNFNPASRFLFRLGEADLGSSLKAIPAYIDIGTVLPQIESAFAEGRDNSLEIEAHGRHFEVKVQLFQASRKGGVGAVVSFVEITDLRRALEDYRVQKQQMKAITENTPALITMKDSQGVYTYANTRFHEVTGLEPEQVLGRTDEELFGPEQGGTVRSRDFEVLKQRRAQQSEEALALPSGVTRWWLASRFPLLDGQNRAHAVCTVSLDISERVLHEQELTLFRRALSEATDGLAILSDRGDGYRTLFRSGRLMPASLPAGPEGGAALDTLLEALLDGAEQLDRVALRAAILQRASSNATYCRGDADEETWIQLCSTQLDFGAPHPRYLVLMLSDISEQTRHQKELEEHKEALSRFSRFAALGEVAAGISHELGTPLNAITTKTELLRRMVASERIDPPRMEKTTRDIDRMVDNIDQVIAGLKSVSRMTGRNRTERISARRLVEDSLQIVRAASWRHRVPIEVDLPAEELVFECNPVQIGQILVNLVNNALDAVADQDPAAILVRAQRHGDLLLLEVEDNGPGVPPEIAEKVMTPFFTTKSAEKGTGLGLSLSRNIARHHGGELELLSGTERTTFRLSLPLQPAAVPTAQEETTES